MAGEIPSPQTEKAGSIFSGKKYSIWLLALLLLVAGVLFVEREQIGNLIGLQRQEHPTLIAGEQLIKANQPYVDAIAAMTAGDFVSAIPLLQTALAQTEDPREINIINGRLAYAYEVTRDYVRAIELLKGIASSPESSAFVRAISIQRMGLMYYNSLKDPKITKAVFTGEPYASLYVERGTNLSYRHLFEYVTTIHPLSFSEYSIAFWYANSIEYVRASSTIPAARKTSLVDAYSQEITRRVTAGEAGIEELQGAASGYDLIAALERRAALFAKLEEIGKASLGGNPDLAFNQLFDAYQKVTPSWDAVPRIEYAAYLIKKDGAARDSDIRSALAPIYTGDEPAKNKALQLILKNSRGAKSRNRPLFISLAGVDPQFKNLLLTSGWSKTDFATSTGAGLH